jgi:hypothetical protein
MYRFLSRYDCRPPLIALRCDRSVGCDRSARCNCSAYKQPLCGSSPLAQSPWQLARKATHGKPGTIAEASTPSTVAVDDRRSNGRFGRPPDPRCARVGAPTS